MDRRQKQIQKEMEGRARQIEELKTNLITRANELQNSSNVMSNAAKEASRKNFSSRKLNPNKTTIVSRIC